MRATMTSVPAMLTVAGLSEAGPSSVAGLYEAGRGDRRRVRAAAGLTEASYRRRFGFTLVELLVVIAIMVALMAMIALAAPRFAERQGPSRGAMQLQSWLN